MTLGNSIRYGLQGRNAQTFPVPDRRVGTWFRDDFLNQLVGTFTGIAGGGNSIGGIQDRDGIWTASVTAVADAALYNNGSGNTNMRLGGAFQCEWDLRLIALSDGVNNVVIRCGIGDVLGAGDQADGTYFEYDFATHGNHHWFASNAKGAARNKIDTGMSPVALTFNRLRDAAATAASFYIDDTLVAQNALDVPTNASMAVFCQVTKQLGAGNLNVQADWVESIHNYKSKR